MVRNFTGGRADITHPEGQRPALRLLDRLRDKMRDYQESTGNLYNLEATISRRYYLPVCQGRPEALARDYSGRHRREAVLHQLLAAAGGLHRRPPRH